MTCVLRHRGIVAVLAMALAAGAGCRARSEEEVETTSPVAVKTAAATRGTIRSVVHATGLVSPAPGAELRVVASEAARIVEIPHATGERVRRGDVLVRFEIPSLAAEVQKQQAEVTRAEAGLETAKAAQTRARELFDRGVAARREVEEATRAVADAEAAIAQAKASLDAARTMEGHATVRATFDGVVAARNHDPGDFVEPSSSDPVLRIIDPDRLEVIASVPLADVASVQVGASARLVSGPAGTAGSPDLKVQARPTAVEAGTATVSVRLAFVRPTNLPVGAPVQLDIDGEQHRNVVLIPAAALVRETEVTSVFVASAGKAHRRPVEIGLATSESVEIKSGIDAGDRVIVDGQVGLPDDAAVTETPSDSPAEATPAKDEK